MRGTGQLVRLDLRLDRIRIPVWTLAVAGLVLTSAASVINLYSTPEEIAAYVSLIDISPKGDPAGLLIRMDGATATLAERPGNRLALLFSRSTRRKAKWSLPLLALMPAPGPRPEPFRMLKSAKLKVLPILLGLPGSRSKTRSPLSPRIRVLAPAP